MPMEASVTHSVANTFKACVAATLELEKYTFETAEVYKAYLTDPSGFTGPSGSGGGDAAASKVVVKEEEVKEAPPAPRRTCSAAETMSETTVL